MSIVSLGAQHHTSSWSAMTDPFRVAKLLVSGTDHVSILDWVTWCTQHPTAAREVIGQVAVLLDEVGVNVGAGWIGDGMTTWIEAELEV